MSLLEEENELIDKMNIRSILISNIKKIHPYNHFNSIKIINLPEVFDETWILKRVLSEGYKEFYDPTARFKEEIFVFRKFGVSPEGSNEINCFNCTLNNMSMITAKSLSMITAKSLLVL